MPNYRPATINELQTARHWRIWKDVVDLNHWRVVKGVMDPRAQRTATAVHVETWNHAAASAEQHRRAITADDLRKGSYAAALGRFASLTEFTNADLDRVFNVFRCLLIGSGRDEGSFLPGDIAALRDHTAYQQFDSAQREIARCKRLHLPCALRLPDDPGERRRHINFLEGIPTHILAAIAKDKTGQAWWEDLPIQELRQLTMTLKNRRDYRQPTPAPAAAPETADIPF